MSPTRHDPVILPEGTPGKYTVVATLAGKMVKTESRSTAEAAAALRAKWEAEGFVVEVRQGTWPGT